MLKKRRVWSTVAVRTQIIYVARGFSVSYLCIAFQNLGLNPSSFSIRLSLFIRTLLRNIIQSSPVHLADTDMNAVEAQPFSVILQADYRLQCQGNDMKFVLRTCRRLTRRIIARKSGIRYSRKHKRGRMTWQLWILLWLIKVNESVSFTESFLLFRLRYF